MTTYTKVAEPLKVQEGWEHRTKDMLTYLPKRKLFSRPLSSYGIKLVEVAEKITAEETKKFNGKDANGLDVSVEEGEQKSRLGRSGEIHLQEEYFLLDGVRYPFSFVNSFGVADVGHIQVRTTTLKRSKLDFRPFENPYDISVLVLQDPMGNFCAYGWLQGHQAMEKRFYENPPNPNGTERFPLWAVPREYTYPMEMLPEWAYRNIQYPDDLVSLISHPPEAFIKVLQFKGTTPEERKNEKAQKDKERRELHTAYLQEIKKKIPW